jgi:hypothetical protein
MAKTKKITEKEFEERMEAKIDFLFLNREEIYRNLPDKEKINFFQLFNQGLTFRKYKI